MTQNQTPISQEQTSVMASAVTPLLLFLGSLTAVLMLSLYFILPRFTKVAVGNVIMDGTEVRGYAQKLETTIANAESQRSELLLPTSDPLYNTLKEEKRADLSIRFIHEEITQAASSAAKNQATIALREMNRNGDTLTLRGDVRAGPSSMTYLAGFVEEVGKLPFVTSVTQPLFSRLEENGEFHSPFEFTATIHPITE